MSGIAGGMRSGASRRALGGARTQLHERGGAERDGAKSKEGLALAHGAAGRKHHSYRTIDCYAADATASAERPGLVPPDRRVSAASRADYEGRSRFGASLKESAASLPAMKICVLGLGYVGAVSAGLLAKEGHEVIGVDPERTKVDLINEGRSPIIEKDLGEIIAAEVKSGRLHAATNLEDAVRHTDISFVCVGTPSQANGGIDLKYIKRVCEQIGRTLASHPGAPVIVFRSTMLPGTMRSVVIPLLEKFSGKRAGEEFGVCINPEFLREGTAVHDYYHPPKTVIGEVNKASGDVLANLYGKLPAPMVRTDIETAEMVKYADNCWHALKVGFANEIGSLCKAIDVDAHRVMEIFCQDQKLNLSPYYLKPGFAFGGSCLPKDLRALLYKAKTLDVSLPILSSVLPSNQLQIERGVQAVVEKGAKKIGILGFSFKAGTDDLDLHAVFMELSAGDCALARRAAGYVERVYALDVSEDIMGRLGGPPNLVRVVHDGVRIPVPEAVVDVAFSRTLVISQLGGICRALKDGGVHYTNSHGPAAELRALFLEAGFSTLRFYVNRLRIPYPLARVLDDPFRLAAIK